MAIPQDLLDILICPACKSDLELKADGSGLRCTNCHLLYSIKDDVPNMRVDQARLDV